LDLVFYDQVDSTNEEAKRLVAAGRPTGFAIFAARQTAGRGRLNRVWQTLSGNLAATIVVSPSTAIGLRSTIALMSGLAIFDVVKHRLGGRHDLAIKWPNDILIDGAKVSGTLIEADDATIYVGIGINIATKPDGLPCPTVALADITDIDVTVLAHELVHVWTAYYRRWDTYGFEPLLSSYNSKLYKIGQKIRFAFDRDKANWISGRSIGVNAQGQLLIKDDEGKITALSAGDVDVPG
jgi:BirA family biotin operon repressor/biotin-[acetyl-CoA-carboxylase] ligase